MSLRIESINHENFWCRNALHRWSAWSEPNPATFSLNGADPQTTLSQTRRCSVCEVQQFRELPTVEESA